MSIKLGFGESLRTVRNDGRVFEPYRPGRRYEWYRFAGLLPALVGGPVAPTPPRSFPSGHWLPGGVYTPATRHPATVFLPFGLGPPPGWGDACVQALLKVARSRVQRLGFLDFTDDLRLVTTDVERDTSAADMAGVTSLLGDMGIRCHAKEGKTWRPTRCTPRLGFEADAHRGAVRMEERKVLGGPRPREEIFGASPGSEMSARAFLASASFLNVIPGGFWVVSGLRGRFWLPRFSSG